MEIDVGVPVRIDEVAGFRAFISAASGYGKSYLAARVCEEFLERGFLVVVVDPEGEYHTLRERYKLLVAGRDVPLSVGDAGLYAKLVVEKNVSLVLDLSAAELSDVEAQEFFTKFGDTLFQLESQYRRPLLLVVEEAEVFAPQHMRPASLVACNRIAKRGRKRGLHSLWVTQRSQDFSKMVLSQCNYFFIGRLTHERDLKAVEPYIGEAVSRVPSLEPGSFILTYSVGSKVHTLLFKTAARRTPHGADTPFKPIQAAAPELSSLAEEFSKMLEEECRRREAEKSEVEKLKARIQELEDLLKEKEQEIERLRTAHEVVKLLPGVVVGDSQAVAQFKVLADQIIQLRGVSGDLSPEAIREFRRQLRVKRVFDELTGRELEIYVYIKEHPGVNKAKLMDAFCIGKHSLNLVLSKLKRLRLVREERRSGRCLFYAKDPS